jgi:hypothetical protein
VEPGGVWMLAEPTNQSRKIGRWLTLFAALSLLTMPVDYKGGAELAHAHGLFQFWFPGGHADFDAFDHHHPQQDQDDGQTSSEHRAGDTSASQKFDSSPDSPAFSEMGAPAEKSSEIAVSMLLALLAIFATRRTLLLSEAQALAGLIPLPEIPPPRNVLNSHT